MSHEHDIREVVPSHACLCLANHMNQVLTQGFEAQIELNLAIGLNFGRGSGRRVILVQILCFR